MLRDICGRENLGGKLKIPNFLWGGINPLGHYECLCSALLDTRDGKGGQLPEFEIGGDTANITTFFSMVGIKMLMTTNFDYQKFRGKRGLKFSKTWEWVIVKGAAYAA